MNEKNCFQFYQTSHLEFKLLKEKLNMSSLNMTFHGFDSYKFLFYVFFLKD